MTIRSALKSRRIAACATLMLLILVQSGCIPTDPASTSDPVSTIGSEVLNQAVNFFFSFLRSALAAFLL